MKKIFTILFASFVLITISTNGNSENYTKMGLAIFLKHDLTIMPNAATKDVKIIFKATIAGEAVIAVLDESGKKVLQQSVTIALGNNNINIDNFHSLNEGNYTIELISNNETHSTKFIFWK